MSKLIASFLFFSFLLSPLVISQFIHHSFRVTDSISEEKLDQRAKKAWDGVKKPLDYQGYWWNNWDLPIRGRFIFTLSQMKIVGINEKYFANFSQTMKERSFYQPYAQLSPAIKAELRKLVKGYRWYNQLNVLYKSEIRKYGEIFWNKLRIKYLDYLKNYQISQLSYNYHDPSQIFFTKLLFRYNSQTSYYDISKNARLKSRTIPQVTDNGWELMIRKAINAAALESGDQKIFLIDGKTAWEKTLRISYLSDLKKYQLSQIDGVEITGLLTSNSKREFLELTFQQQDQIHNLVDLPNYQASLRAAINQKRAEKFWQKLTTKKKLRQLLNQQITSFRNVKIDRLNFKALTYDYQNLTFLQKNQVKNLSKLTNFASINQLAIVEKTPSSNQTALIIILSIKCSVLWYMFGLSLPLPLKKVKIKKNPKINN